MLYKRFEEKVTRPLTRGFLDVDITCISLDTILTSKDTAFQNSFVCCYTELFRLSLWGTARITER